MTTTDSGFEKYKGGPTGDRNARMYASIARSGRIMINDRLYQMLGKPAAVCLLYNRELNHIALQPANSADPDAFPFRANNGSQYLAAVTFCTHYNIRVAATQRFLSPRLAPDGNLILNLSATASVARRTRQDD